MTTHLTEEDLVLHYYGETTDAEDRRVSGHIAECGACHAEYRRLQRVLAIVDEAAVAGPVLADHFERTVWARLEPNLRPERPGWFAWIVLSPARLGWAAAVLLLVSGAFFAGRMLPRSADAPRQAAASAEQVREGILLMDLSDHLDRSQMMLVELVSADADVSRDVSSDRARAEQLVASNRLYRQTAASTGEGAVVALLDELERLLVDLAASPETMSAEELASVRRRIDAQGLLFKVRALSSEVRDRQKTTFRMRTAQGSSM